MFKQLIKTFTTLLQCGTLGVEPEAEIVQELTPEMLSKLYMVASKHDVAHLIALALQKANLLGEDEISRKYQKSIFQAAKRYEKAKYEEQCVFEIFEKNQIAFVPLKGTIVEEYYLEPWMRTRVDVDVLIKESELEKAEELLATHLHYDIEEKKYHDLTMLAPSGVCVELHFSILENRNNIDLLLARVWDYVAQVKDSSYRHQMDMEFFVFHILAHMSYHFASGGCGARYITDMWLLQRSGVYDKAKVYELCKQAGIQTFADYVYKLADIWFGDGQHDEVSKMMERYIIAYGAFGTRRSRIMAQRVKGKSKSRYLWEKVFVPYESLCLDFPKLRKRPLLYPYYVVQNCGKVIKRTSSKAVVRELKANNKMKQSSIDKLEYLLEKLQLMN